MMSDDLRDVSAGDYWSRFEAMMGADGLMTYRYLGRKTVTLHDVDHDSMMIRRDMRNAGGGIMAAPLAIASAEAGGFTDIESIPAPVTANLHILDPGRDVREILIQRTLVHAGRSMGFTRSEIRDAADPARLLAIAHGTGIKLGDAPAGFQPIETGPAIEDSPSLPPLHAAFGASKRADGTWQLPALSPGASSTSGSLHLGPTHVVLEAAAMEMAARTVGADALQIEDWSVMFVARGTHGSFSVTGSADRGGLDRIACHLSLHDEGRGGRIVASAIAIFRMAG
jgi:hypothetical protein